MTLLRTEGLIRDFDGLRAVDQVDFDLSAGEIRAVIGPNGAGKTTFVSLLSGRLTPSDGSVIFDGDDITRLPAHKRVGLGIAYTFQITSIFSNLSLYDNIALAVQRRERDRLSGEVYRVLDQIGLAERAGEIAGAQSYGHQRLLEIGMGLALQPKLLILDEPTQGLSEGEIESFLGLIREISDQATILLIEHNMDVVMALATRITVLDQGRVLADGAPEDIQADAAVQSAYLGGRDAEA